MALSALECGIDSWLAAEPLGGMAALREKSLALTDLFIELVEQRCAGQGLGLQTPRAPALRGSQVSFLREDGAYAIVQALIARGVVGDYRAPGLLRFGFTPLYLRYEDVWHAVATLAEILERRLWDRADLYDKHAVT